MKLKKMLLSLGKIDYYFAFTTFVLLGSMRLGLLLLPFRSLLKLVEASQSNEQDRVTISTIGKVKLRKIIWGVDVATRYMPGGAKCLARALTTQVLMSRYGYTPELRIGVSKGESGLEAHAWIEYQGQIVIGYLPDLPRYVQLPSLEGIKL